MLLTEQERPAAEVHRLSGRSPVVLACEHASNRIPAALDGLGLDEAGQVSHAAWDIGARDLSLALSERLDAVFVASCVSRLVHDCNRPLGAPGAIPPRSEVIDVPGNQGLSAEDRVRREQEVHGPFHKMLGDVLAQRDVPPVLVTIHSFTPVFHGQPRAVELGILHGADDRLARGLLKVMQAETGLVSDLNAPYGPEDGVLYTLERHALSAGHLNVMIEVRNDLLRAQDQIQRMADLLAAGLQTAVPPLLEARA